CLRGIFSLAHQPAFVPEKNSLREPKPKRCRTLLPDLSRAPVLPMRASEQRPDSRRTLRAGLLRLRTELRVRDAPIAGPAPLPVRTFSAPLASDRCKPAQMPHDVKSSLRLQNRLGPRRAREPLPCGQNSRTPDHTSGQQSQACRVSARLLFEGSPPLLVIVQGTCSRRRDWNIRWKRRDRVRLHSGLLRPLFHICLN